MEAEKTSLLNMLAASIQAVNLHDLVLEDDLAIFAQRVMQATNKMAGLMQKKLWQ